MFHNLLRILKYSKPTREITLSMSTDTNNGIGSNSSKIDTTYVHAQTPALGVTNDDT